jgi:hypothetical protein
MITRIGIIWWKGIIYAFKMIHVGFFLIQWNILPCFKTGRHVYVFTHLLLIWIPKCDSSLNLIFFCFAQWNARKLKYANKMEFLRSRLNENYLTFFKDIMTEDKQNVNLLPIHVILRVIKQYLNLKIILYINKQHWYLCFIHVPWSKMLGHNVHDEISSSYN